MTATYPDLSGRAALVTGASSGIGSGIAEALLRQGMRVGVQYRGGKAAADALCSKYPDRAAALRADLSSESGCAQLAAWTVERLGGCEVLVHSAGIWNAGPIGSMSSAALEDMFRVNTFSAFYLVRELLPALRARGRG